MDVDLHDHVLKGETLALNSIATPPLSIKRDQNMKQPSVSEALPGCTCVHLRFFLSSTDVKWEAHLCSGTFVPAYKPFSDVKVHIYQETGNYVYILLIHDAMFSERKATWNFSFGTGGTRTQKIRFYVACTETVHTYKIHILPRSDNMVTECMRRIVSCPHCQ